MDRQTAARIAIRFVDISLDFANAGIVEATGRNDGPQLDKIEKAWGMKGEPYCAMGQCWAFAKAYAYETDAEFDPAKAVESVKALQDEIAKKLVRFDPLCATMIADAKKRGTWRPFEKRSDVTMISPGDLVFMNFGTDSSPKNHVGMFHSHDGATMWLVEWNTTPANTAKAPDDAGDPPPPKPTHVKEEGDNDPRKGGCYYKNRYADPSTITGWVSWQLARPRP